MKPEEALSKIREQVDIGLNHNPRFVSTPHPTLVRIDAILKPAGAAE